MEVTIPMGTEVKVHGTPTLFKVSNKMINIGNVGVSKYQLVDATTRMPHSMPVTVDELVIVNNRALYQRVIEQKILSKKALVKSLNQAIKGCKTTLGELEKFSSDETELLDLIEKFKVETPSIIQKIIKLKEHINFGKFLGEWT